MSRKNLFTGQFVDVICFFTSILLAIFVLLVLAVSVLLISTSNNKTAFASDSAKKDIFVKNEEMVQTAVMVETQFSTGSGTIIDKIDASEPGLFEYRVLTNAHVVRNRFSRYIRDVNGLTGKLYVQVVDNGCVVLTFDHNGDVEKTYNSKVVEEDKGYDLAILSFVSDDELNVARIADKKILGKVRIFDNVFAVGCQLGGPPLPTTGIISSVWSETIGENNIIIYGYTAQVSQGSSGGSLFKQYKGHYYLIGIPYCVSITLDGQILPHLAHAISMRTADKVISRTLVSSP